MKKIPNFIIAGGVTTGTSFLSAVLAKHPEIYLPKIQRPEPNFFHYSWKYNNGIDWYLDQWFHEVQNQRAIGERSSLLLPSDYAATRLKASFPKIKLIFCLRNPIERAWGNYRFSVLEGLEDLSFEKALDSEVKRVSKATGKWAEVQPNAYTIRSKYSKHLKEYFELFGRENILLIKSEDMGKSPHKHIAKVCEFLNVEPDDTLPLPPNYSSPSVLDITIQPKLRAYFGERFSQVIEAIRKEKDLDDIIKTEDDRKMLSKLRKNLCSGKNPLPPESRERLQNIFAREIKELKKIVDFSVEDWV
jgi:hypothetical protein